MKFIWTLLALLFTADISAREPCVILLHGLARTDDSMDKMEEHLQAAGYLVANVSYPSREASIETLAPLAIESGLKECGKSPSISFVTHSLGGILVRYYLAEHAIAGLHRVVMLGPPNHGSEVVDKLGDFPGFHFINGDAGLQLGTGEDSVPVRLGPANFEAGVIAGTDSINLILSQLIPGPDDGKVSTQSARLEGMQDYIEVEVSHPFLMKDDEVIHQVLAFLANGQFDREQDQSG